MFRQGPGLGAFSAVAAEPLPRARREHLGEAYRTEPLCPRPGLSTPRSASSSLLQFGVMLSHSFARLARLPPHSPPRLPQRSWSTRPSVGFRLFGCLVILLYGELKRSSDFCDISGFFLLFGSGQCFSSFSILRQEWMLNFIKYHSRLFRMVM